MKSLILFQKGVDAMEDNCLVIAESFFTESINSDPTFPEAYLLRAMVKFALLPENCRDDNLISIIGDDLQTALKLKPSLLKAVDDVVHRKLTPQNHKYYQSF